MLKKKHLRNVSSSILIANRVQLMSIKFFWKFMEDLGWPISYVENSFVAFNTKRTSIFHS